MFHLLFKILNSLIKTVGTAGTGCYHIAFQEGLKIGVLWIESLTFAEPTFCSAVKYRVPVIRQGPGTSRPWKSLNSL